MSDQTNVQRYIAWVRDTALPFWATSGFDVSAGRFRERLDWGGQPLAVPHRSMLQARQIYVYSHAAILGWHREGSDLADRAMRSLRRDFCTVDAGQASVAFSIDGAGNVVNADRDAYAHAFVLFATAWLYRLTGDPSLLVFAQQLNVFIRTHLVDHAHGGLFDAWPATGIGKRQNPAMHLLEAYLALERAAPGHGYFEDAQRLVTLFQTKLFDATRGVLPEYYSDDWSVSTDPQKPIVFEPGHHFEWCWLLREYAALAHERSTNIHTAAASLFEVARQHGIAPTGLIYDELSLDKAVHKSSHRIWPHTEAIKAAMAMDTPTYRRPDASLEERMAAVLLGHFLDKPVEGCWIDHIDASGAPLTDAVPASSLYHLFFAAAEASR